MKKNYLIRNINLTKLVDYCNDNFEKQTKTKFTISDIQGYTRRGYLPIYFGDIKIESNKDSGITLYSLYKKEEQNGEGI